VNSTLFGKHQLDQPPEPHGTQEWVLKAREPTGVNPMGYVGPTRSASFPTDVDNVLTRFGQDAWACPPSHPIKGNFTTYSSEPCIYYMPGGQFYSKTKPERCYATEEDAQKDGCRRSKR
jgi:hypothetical protein